MHTIRKFGFHYLPANLGIYKFVVAKYKCIDVQTCRIFKWDVFWNVWLFLNQNMPCIFNAYPAIAKFWGSVIGNLAHIFNYMISLQITYFIGPFSAFLLVDFDFMFINVMSNYTASYINTGLRKKKSSLFQILFWGFLIISFFTAAQLTY